MKVKATCLLLLMGFLLSACGNQYAPPPGVPTARLQLKDDGLGKVFLKGIAWMPYYSMSLADLDGKVYSGISQNITIAAGQHTVSVNCGVNGRSAGSANFSFYAKPGRVYTLSYPPELKGYNYLVTACNYVRLS
jgi:hypothetical protein